MLEAQQKMMGTADFWSLKPILMPSDAGALRARRILDKLIADEKMPSAPTFLIAGYVINIQAGTYQ